MGPSALPRQELFTPSEPRGEAPQCRWGLPRQLFTQVAVGEICSVEGLSGWHAHGGLPLPSTARRTTHLRPAKFKSRESAGKATALAGWGREGERGPPYPTTSEKILNPGASR